MRILELRLHAFGPFTNKCLDFSSHEVGLHLVFGPNEAGKSSALRALKCLLFGIPKNTQDNFLHDYNRLKVGACLRLGDGSTLEIVRRKGTKNTLLGSDGASLDGAADKILPGIVEDLFCTAFCIDHDRLVAGGQDILRGGGRVGESLFGASLGGTGLLTVLEDLDKEASGLFVPLGKKQIINAALTGLADAKKAVSERSLPPSKWAEHDNALKTAEQRRQQVASTLKQLRTEVSRLERLKLAIPKLSSWQTEVSRLAELDEVRILPPDSLEQYKTHKSSLDGAQTAAETTGKTLEGIKRRIEGLTVPEVLLEQAECIADLHQRLGSHQKAAQDRGGLVATRQQLMADASSLLASLLPGQSVETARREKITLSERTRISELGVQRESIISNLERAKSGQNRIMQDLAEATDRLKRGGETIDASELRTAAAEARREGDLESDVFEAITNLRAEEEQVEVNLARLGLWSGTLEELERRPVPSLETLERFESAFDSQQSDLALVDNHLAELQSGTGEVQQKIEALFLSGTIPEENDLNQARLRRGEGWQLVRRAWLEQEDVSLQAREYSPNLELPEAFDQSIVAADEVADQLRREADRVAEKANLDAQLAKYLRNQTSGMQEKQQRQAEFEQTRKEWLAAWEQGGITPLPPKEMRSWLSNRSELLRQAEAIRALKRKQQSLSDRVSGHSERLVSCLCHLQVPTDPQWSLPELQARADVAVEAIEEANRKREALVQEISELSKKATEATTAVGGCQAQVDEWKASWAQAVLRIGLETAASPTTANAVLLQLDEFYKKVDEADGLGRRVDGIDHDAKVFETDTMQLVLNVAPDLASLSPEQAVSALYSRLSVARQDSGTRTALIQQREEQEVSLEEESAKRDAAERQLKEMCEHAACSDYPALLKAIELSDTYAGLLERITTLEDELLPLAGGGTIESLVAEARDVDFDSIPARLAEALSEIDDLEKEHTQLAEKIGEERTLLDQMDGRGEAAEAAWRAQQIVADLRMNVEKYVRARLAHAVLQREIERYRVENQKWLLTRASGHFEKMTLSSFYRLETDVNERNEPILLGIRPSEEQVTVDGMSDGTRDQLYLALRLASLERYLENNESVPFVADDILIQFDEERAKATIELLADLSQTSNTQILLFTHHAKIIEIANTSTAKGTVVCHVLDASNRGVA